MELLLVLGLPLLGALLQAVWGSRSWAAELNASMSLLTLLGAVSDGPPPSMAELVTLARAGGYDIRAHAGSGRITAPDVTVSGTISRHEVNGKLRGGGPLVDVQADSGHIDIR